MNLRIVVDTFLARLRRRRSELAQLKEICRLMAAERDLVLDRIEGEVVIQARLRQGKK